MTKHLTLYSDGGSRGNPGPAAAAFLALENGEVVKADSRFLGVRTNNQAEYEALISALDYAFNAGAEEVTCYLDSELVGRQMKGEYSVKNLEMRRLYLKAHALRVRFKKAEFYNVARTNSFIQKADALVNKTLDEQP
jgi:ribonuclease HI